MSVFSFRGIWDIRRYLKKHFFGVEGLSVYFLFKKNINVLLLVDVFSLPIMNIVPNSLKILFRL